MNLYLDSAYIAKCYINEPDATAVRNLVRRAAGLHSSAWCLAEMACIFHRQIREKTLSPDAGARLRRAFRADVEEGVWTLAPVTDSLLHRVEAVTGKLTPEVLIRAGDAVHLITAGEGGFSEIWTNDPRLLAAAVHFGLEGRSI